MSTIFLGGIRKDLNLYIQKYGELVKGGNIVHCPNLSYEAILSLSEENGKIFDYETLKDDCLRQVEVSDLIIFYIEDDKTLTDVCSMVSLEYNKAKSLNKKIEINYINEKDKDIIPKK